MMSLLEAARLTSLLSELRAWGFAWFSCITEAAYKALPSVLAVVLHGPLCALCTRTDVTQHQPVLT